MVALFSRRTLGAGLVTALAFPALSPLAAQQVDVWSRPLQAERSRTCDFIHYRVSLSFDLDAKVFRGENRITLTPFADGLERCELDAEEIIIETALDETGRELSFELSDTSVIIALPRTLSYGDTLDLTVVPRFEDSKLPLRTDIYAPYGGD